LVKNLRLRRLALAGVAIAALFMVSGCWGPQKLTGSYLAVDSALFGLIKIPHMIEFHGDWAVYGVALRSDRVDKAQFLVEYHGGQVYVHKMRLDDGLAFIVRDNGEKLECTSCARQGLPVSWVKQR
jgi:hypothetical protein